MAWTSWLLHLPTVVFLLGPFLLQALAVLCGAHVQHPEQQPPKFQQSLHLFRLLRRGILDCSIDLNDL